VPETSVTLISEGVGIGDPQIFQNRTNARFSGSAGLKFCTYPGEIRCERAHNTLTLSEPLLSPWAYSVYRTI